MGTIFCRGKIKIREIKGKKCNSGEAKWPKNGGNLERSL